MSPASPPGVLVVEDESDLADLYGEWLSETYAVRVAYRGESALEKLDDSVDVVLLDRRIPDLSGDEVLAEIRARNLDCRVAMVTAVSPEFDVVEMGFDDYLVKPVTDDELTGVVDRLLRRSTYATDVQEYFALASKKAVLDAELPADEREASETYAELQSSLARTYATMEDTLSSLDREDYEALFHDLTDDPPAPR